MGRVGDHPVLTDRSRVRRDGCRDPWGLGGSVVGGAFSIVDCATVASVGAPVLAAVVVAVDGGLVVVTGVWMVVSRTTTGTDTVRVEPWRVATRIAALHDLVQPIPSPVLAGLIAYNPYVIANRAAARAAARAAPGSTTPPYAPADPTARVEPSIANA